MIRWWCLNCRTPEKLCSPKHQQATLILNTEYLRKKDIGTNVDVVCVIMVNLSDSIMIISAVCDNLRWEIWESWAMSTQDYTTRPTWMSACPWSSSSSSSLSLAGPRFGMRLNVSCGPVCQSDRGVIRGIKGIEGGLSLRARIHNEIKAPGAPQWSPHGQLGTNMLPLL